MSRALYRKYMMYKYGHLVAHTDPRRNFSFVLALRGIRLNTVIYWHFLDIIFMKHVLMHKLGFDGPNAHMTQ
jgi:hypothetical protein